MKLPFNQIKKDNKTYREFLPNVDDEDLKWHYDLEDRIIIPLNKNDWMFQKDNSLPENIDKQIFIKAGEWHRVIKGETKLLIEVIFN
jgi:hypothetical protein